MERVTIQDAREKFAEVIGRAESGRVVLTRYGRGAVCMVPLKEGKLLERLERSGELAALMERHPEDV